MTISVVESLLAKAKSEQSETRANRLFWIADLISDYQEVGYDPYNSLAGWCGGTV